MRSTHPIDELGRVLPAADWPTEKAAPVRLDLIRQFCNTTNLESGADRFESLDGLQAWLDDQAMSGSATDADRIRIVKFREVIRASASEHHQPAATELDSALGQCVEGVQLSLAVRDGQLAAVAANGTMADRVIATVALAMIDARRDDQWRRFKSCPSCGWVFYDRSKSRTGRWCSMSACGGRAKVAAFRRREKDATK